MKRFALVASFIAAGAASTFAVDARSMRMDDLERMVGVSSPTMSSDGTRAVIVVTRSDFKEDKYVRELDLVDIASHARRTLTGARNGLSDPQFSPDGTKLAFLADAGSGDDAKTQVWLMPLDGGDARTVTNASEGVEQFSWRPDGGALAYAAEDTKPKKTGAERFRDSFLFTTEPITARAEPRAVHLFTLDLATRRPKELTFGSQSVATGEAQSTLSWSKDGKTLAFVLAPNAILNDADRAKIELIDVATGTATELTSHEGFQGDPHFSPDGERIAYAHSQGDNQSNLTEAYVTTPRGGDGTPFSRPFDRAVNDVAWLPDSSALYFTCFDHATMALVKAALGGELTRVDLGGLTITSQLTGAIARDGTMVFVATSARQPAELYVRRPGALPVKLTDYNDTTVHLDLASAEALDFPTSLGPMGDAVLLKPPGFTAGKRYPLVVFIHGGPTSSSTLTFNQWGQEMAARGWLVLEPNYRGSDNLGLAYQRGVLYDPEEGPGKDVMAAVAAVRGAGIVDEGRVAVAGWSYGGIMTAWMISKYHFWSAAVSGASVDDWSTDYGVADDSDSDRALFHGSPFVAGNAAEWRRASAINYVRDVTTPVLILSDIGDNRDPFATSSMYWRALRDNHKDATLRVWPVDGHYPHDPVRAADVIAHSIDYIARHFAP